MDLNNISFFLILIFLSYFFNKYLPIILNGFNSNLLKDNEFIKPQAFHEIPVSITGGVGIFFSFLIVYLYLFFFGEFIYYEYLTFCTLFFFLGLLDDLEITIRPKFRLLTMVFFLLILIIYNNFYIEKTGMDFLDDLLEIDIFALFFVSLCFLFIINGANLLDGFNGLLGIHTLIIISNLFIINYLTGNQDLAFLLLCAIIIIIIFLKYNFPKPKIFLGDSGAYFLGAFVAISVIKTSIANPSISPFYFCILLFYLFFEVFFSFIRKISVEKKSPLFPDNKHLHMLIYNILNKKINNKLKSNCYVSIIINTIYLLLIIPTIPMMTNGLFCKYYSLLFFLVYILSYKILRKKTP